LETALNKVKCNQWLKDNRGVDLPYNRCHAHQRIKTENARGNVLISHACITAQPRVEKKILNERNKQRQK
jgi:hypothetical protein